MTLGRLKESVRESVFVQDAANLERLEKLLVGLLGSEQELIRNCAIQYLNVLYDR